MLSAAQYPTKLVNPGSVYTHRLQRLQESLAASPYSALVLNPGPTMHYLTGLDFHLMERPVLMVVPTEGTPRILLPTLETLKLSNPPYPITHEAYGEDPTTWAEVAARILHGLSGRVGAESRGLRLLETSLIARANDALRLEAADGLIASVRGRKDAAEIDVLRRAVRVAEQAVTETLSSLERGTSERELADELVLNLLRSGSNLDLPFSPIVSFGENSANPHASPSQRRLQDGDLVLIDWGARLDGYVSDLTRVYAFGTVPDELQRIAEVVEAANLAAQQVAAPGVPAGEVDRAARKVITDAGYGERFVHRTGHGIGLEAHEDPYMRGDNEQPLEVGHAFTIEPGIYVPGLGGVRIEDDVVVTSDGVEVLSTLPRALTPIG